MVKMGANEGLVPVKVTRTPPGALCSWAEGLDFLLPGELLEQSGLVAGLDGRGGLEIGSQVAVSPDCALRLRSRRAFTERPPSSSRSPIPYRMIPTFFRTLVARGIGMVKRRQLLSGQQSPGWPLDLAGDFLADLASVPDPGRQSGATPVLLTHDLDTPEGLRNLVDRFLTLEESVGARSTSFFVPCRWPLDHGQLGQVVSRGHGLGIHGFDHMNKTAFADPAGRKERLGAARDLIGKYGIKGFRAPSLLRTRELLGDLAPLYQFDSSVTTAGGIFPVPFRGCASSRPFVLAGIMEIPLSLPPEAGLCFLSYSPDQILHMWIECAEAIAASGGVVVVLTHCENRFSGKKKLFTMYRKFLEYLAQSSKFRWSSPEEILAAHGSEAQSS